MASLDRGASFSLSASFAKVIIREDVNCSSKISIRTGLAKFQTENIQL